MAQACTFPTLCSFRSGQSHSFRALSICRCSWLENFDPGSAELAHGSRLVPCGSVRGPDHGSRLPFSFPLLILLRAITFY
jgi:hypothetical protein